MLPYVLQEITVQHLLVLVYSILSYGIPFSRELLLLSFFMPPNDFSPSLLLQERADIRDGHDAKPLKLRGGSIEFENVHFG